MNNLKEQIRAYPYQSKRKTYNQVMRIRKMDPLVQLHPNALPTFISVKSIMNRVIKSLRPPLPLINSDIRLDSDYTLTLDNKTFLISNENNELLIFSTHELLECLCNADQILMDGTFFSCPLLFKQLYTIHMINHTIIPCAYILLPNKKKETYFKMLDLLKNYCLSIGFLFSPPKALIDFEMGVLRALEEMFPTISVKGCYFHYCQCILRRIQGNRLAAFSRLNPDFKRFYRRLMAISFLTEMDIPLVLSELKSEVEAFNLDPIRDLFTYFKNTWINLNAKFKYKMWNMYDVQGVRTNNHVEGFHRSLKEYITYSHPNLYLFIDILKQIQQDMDIKFIQLRNGKKVTERKKKYCIIDEKYFYIMLLIHQCSI
ncbi:uncharacterized protein LOC135923892 [Gordionus sp. m RMFG-2023]|uniref:uncharacterized protein LOC135923892 n=1 Tax=Gordionus sp. m RMFG-2023 TaxID=3053472 RepID=UPI0031FD5704